MSENEILEQVGRVGQMRLEYIKEHRPRLYAELMASGELLDYLRGVEEYQGDTFGTVYRQSKQHDPTLTDSQAEMIAREVSMYYSVNPESERIAYLDANEIDREYEDDSE